jgi:derlin-1
MRSATQSLLWTVALLCTNFVQIEAASRTSSFGALVRPFSSERFQVGDDSINQLLQLRGGASRKKTRTGSLSKTVTGKKKVGAAKKAAEKKSATGDLLQKYKNILPLTRIYISMVGVFTLLGLMLGEETTQALLALDPMRLLYGMELWRPFTAASFLGKPSVGWLMSGYYLFEYGSSLERAFGPAQYMVFLLSQVGILTCMSMLCGLPFFANSVITSMLHVLSRAMPHQKVKWLIFTVPYWSLPYGLMITDCLQAQSAGAAMPHILGILSGHFYHYHRFVWPKTGGQDWLSAPDFLIELLDPNSAKKSAAKESLSKALKSRRRGKGKKLGSSR